MDLNQEWKNGRIPIINGVLHENGEIECINISYDLDYNRVVKRGSNQNIYELIKEKEVYFSKISTFRQIKESKNNIVVSYGGGSYGSEGYIVLESNINFRIIWIAFFEEANPFEKLDIIDDKIIAYNNLNEKWIFDINNPSNLIIE